MSEVKFSKGPWEAWINGYATLSVTGPAAAAALCCRFALEGSEVSSKDHWIEVAASDMTAPALVFGDTKEQCEANARLVAAAPALYEALKSFVYEFGDKTNSATVNKARVALSQAEGA